MNVVLDIFYGDLHKGNWKVRVEDNIAKLVIYDFGFVRRVHF